MGLSTTMQEVESGSVTVIEVHEQDLNQSSSQGSLPDHEYGVKHDADQSGLVAVSVHTASSSNLETSPVITDPAGEPEVAVLHPETELKHQCGSCEQRFASLIGFKRHVRKCHREQSMAERDNQQLTETAVVETSLHLCVACKKKCSSLPDLRRHMVTHCKINNTYYCVLCKTIFSHALDFDKHMRLNHEDAAYHVTSEATPPKFNCTHCNAKYPSMIDLILHLKENHIEDMIIDIPDADTHQARRHKTNKEPSQFSCEQCYKTFRRSNDFARHMLTHDQSLKTENGYKCKDCSKTFSNFRKYQKHSCISCNPARRLSGKVYSMKGQDDSRKCPKCSKKLPGYTALPIHLITHYKTPQGYVCKDCHNSYRSASAFYSHLKTKHNQVEFDPENWLEMDPTEVVCDPQEEKSPKAVVQFQPGKCGQCERVFTSFLALKRHIRNIHGNRVKGTFKCTLCPAVYKEKKNLILHKRAAHSGERPFQCTYCDQSFIGKRHLMRHMAHHTGVKKHMCEICGKRFVEKSDVAKHMRLSHMPVEKKQICPHCSKAFRTPAQLKIHIRLHTGEKPYKCEFCPAAFAQVGPLKYHRSLHTGEKPYICEVCRKAFPTHTAAKNHITKCANKVTIMYQCETCSKQFKRLENLQRHVVSHQSKPLEIIMYQCDLCDEKFVLEQTLIDHKLCAHPHPAPAAEQVTDLQETILLSDIQNAAGEMVTVYITQQ